MDPDIRAVEKYLNNTLRAQCALEPWVGAKNLAAYLRDGRKFYCGQVLGQYVLFVVMPAESPAVMEKQGAALSVDSAMPVVFVLREITPHGRRRLVERGVQFVVPGSQMFMPKLAVNLSERYKIAPAVERLGPAAQVVLLTLIYRANEAGDAGVELTTVAELAGKTGYTPMSVGRALDQLAQLGLVTSTKVGRGRLVALDHPPQQSWEYAQPYLRSPVVSTLAIAADELVVAPGWFVAGDTALAKRSTLSEPRIPEYAVGRTSTATIPAAGIVVPDRRDAAAVVQVWRYEPKLLSYSESVDDLSLYLSLRNDQDPRVQLSLKAMLESLWR